ncbi:MAG: M90 family metallopeptidase [Pseudomonadota bacterium]
MLNCWKRLLLALKREHYTAIPDAQWEGTLQAYPFLAALEPQDQVMLHKLSSQFLAGKEFTGAHGLEVTDAMAVAIAAQACLPVLHLGLKLYDDFLGIVVHPGAMLARRQAVDAAGVVHNYSEVLAGEAMERGPVTLSWEDVTGGADGSDGLVERGHNVVIHEFVHKLDMRDGHANGCPPLPSRAARTAWQKTMQQNYAAFRESVAMHERFGADAPWLDAYGAQSPVEFFAVASEAYFVNRERFLREFPALTTLFDSFFRPAIAEKT